MKKISSELPGLFLIELKVHGDARGFFVERYRSDQMREMGIPVDSFIQDNHSRSSPGVLRGMHYQSEPAQGKLVGVTSGKVWDCVVDIRPNSPTYGKYFGVELSDMNGLLLWIPPGFAHGFCTIGDTTADFFYKVTGIYNPKSESGIRFDDLEVGIKWPIENPIVSDRDRVQKTFEEYKKAPIQWS